MSTSKKNDSEVAPESSALPGGGRWSSKRKLSVILEILRGADLESNVAAYPHDEAVRAGDLRLVISEVSEPSYVCRSKAMVRGRGI